MMTGPLRDTWLRREAPSTTSASDAASSDNCNPTVSMTGVHDSANTGCLLDLVGCSPRPSPRRLRVSMRRGLRCGYLRLRSRPGARLPRPAMQGATRGSPAENPRARPARRGRAMRLVSGGVARFTDGVRLGRPMSQRIVLGFPKAAHFSLPHAAAAARPGRPGGALLE